MTERPDYVRPSDIDERSSFWQRVQWRLEAVAWDLVYWYPMKWIGLERASRLAGWLVARIGPLLSQHRTAVRNLRLAFPDWGEGEVQRVARAAWRNVGATAGELPHLPKIDPYAPGGRVEVIGAEHLDAIGQSAKGAVLVSGHFANWEIMAAVICRRPVDCLVTYRALNNPHIDRRINRLRRDYGIGVLAPKGMATRELMRALSKGRAVALMNDQKFNQGIEIPFFGHGAMTAPGPSRLAVKYGVPVVFMATRRAGPGRFRVEVHPPLSIEPGQDTETATTELTRQITALIEAEVRANPEQWFWMHRRWPKERWREVGVLEPKT